MLVACLPSFHSHNKNSGRHLWSKESKFENSSKEKCLEKLEKNTMNTNSYKDICMFETWRKLKGEQ